MKRLLLIIILSLTFLCPLFAFDCNTLTTDVLCNQLTGCIWNSPTCTGAFTPNCTAPPCYYIDPINGSDSANGSSLTPFKTLTPGFQLLGNQSGSLLVINYNATTDVELLAFTPIFSNIIIGKLFTNSRYFLNLQNFDLTSIPTGQKSAVTLNAGRLEINGAIISSRSIKSGLSVLFELGNATLGLYDVSVFYYQGTALLVEATADKTSAIFNWTSGGYTSSAFQFKLLGGSQVISNVKFTNTTGVGPTLTLGPTATLTNISLIGGQSLFAQLVDGTTFTGQNITMDTYSGNFINATNLFRFMLLSSSFKNLNLQSSTPFIRLSGAVSGYYLTHSVKDTVFQNITVKNSLFLVEIGGQKLTIDNTTMSNIQKWNLTTSQQALADREYASEWAGGVCFLGRKSISLTVTNSYFTMINSHCIGLKASALTMTSNTFNNTALAPVALPTSLDLIDGAYGVSWVVFIQGTTEVSPATTLKVSSCKFIQNKITARYGGAFRFTGLAPVTLTLTDNEFNSNQALYGGAIYSENPLLTINSKNDTFVNNSAREGGAIYKTSNSIVTITYAGISTIFSGSRFVQNQATTKGGSIYLNNEGLSSTNSSFSNNHAQYGGAIYFVEPDNFPFVSRKFSNNTFVSNIATVSGGALKLFFNYSQLNPDSTLPSNFTGNRDMYGLAISDGNPSYYRFSFFDIISDNSPTTFDNLGKWVNSSTLTRFSHDFNTTFPHIIQLKHKSGHALSQIIKVEVYDDQGRVANYINNEAIQVSVTETQNKKSGFQAFLAGSTLSFAFTNGTFYMSPTVKIVGEPQTTATLNFQTATESVNLLQDANLTLNQNMQIYFIDCEVGDIYNPSTRKCDTCPEGTYSLMPPYSNPVCLPCDSSKAICFGGSKLAPKPGYWRFDLETDNILECPETEACLGGNHTGVYSPHGECIFPYTGNLCNRCEPKYAKFGSSSNCINCETDALYYVKFVGFFLVQVIALLYGIKCNIAKISEVKKAEQDEKLRQKITDEDFQSNLMKIFINFVQISSILFEYEFEWPSFITSFGEVTNKLAPNDKDGFSVDCILALITDQYELIYFIKLVVALIQPFGMWIALILCYMLYLKCKKQQIIGNPLFKKNIVVLFIITAFILQPNLIQSTLEVFKCQNFSSPNDPSYYMSENTETKCWTPFHFVWTLAVALPNFLLWTFVLPSILLIKLKRKAKQLNDPEVYAKYSFLYEGLKTDKYYWEFVILGRKIIIVLIYVFFSFISIQAQAYLTLMVVLAFSALHCTLWPYSDERLNRAEMLALLALIVMVYSGMFFISGGGNDWLNTVLIVLSSLFVLVFFCYIGFLFAQSVRKVLRRVTMKISQFSQKIRERRSNKTLTSSTTGEKHVARHESPKFSIVFNKIAMFGSEQFDKSSDVPVAIEPEDKEGQLTIPSELDTKAGTGMSRTVFNEDKMDIDNQSILKSPGLRPRGSKKLTQPNSLVSLLSPDQVHDMLTLIHMKRTSLGNSSDLRYLGRSFSTSEKAVDSVTKVDNAPDEEQKPEEKIEK